MRYVAAYLLAVLGGNENPSANDIKQILNSVGVDAEDFRLDLVISQLKGKDIEDVIASGTDLLATVTFGGAPVAAGEGDAPAPVEEKKDDVKDGDGDSDTDSSDGGLVSLFD